MDDQTPPEEQVVTMTIPVDETPPIIEAPQQNTETQVSGVTEIEQPLETPAVIPEIPPVDSKEIEQAVKPASEKPKEPEHNTTRPCIYCTNKEEIQKKVNQYLIDANQIKGEKAFIPYIEEIAIALNIDDGTFVDWANNEAKHPDLTAAYKKLKTIQKLKLLRRTVGRFNPTGAIFQLKVNHGAVETEKQILAGDKNEPIQIEIIEEANKFSNDE